MVFLSALLLMESPPTSKHSVGSLEFLCSGTFLLWVISGADLLVVEGPLFGDFVVEGPLFGGVVVEGPLFVELLVISCTGLLVKESLSLRSRELLLVVESRDLLFTFKDSQC